MQINSINNTQSFGMACSVTGRLGKALNQCTPSQVKQVKILHDALDQAPQEFVLDLSKKGKAFVGLVNQESSSYVTKTPFSFAHCKPARVVKQTFKDMGKKYSSVAKANVNKDLTETIVNKLNIIR